MLEVRRGSGAWGEGGGTVAVIPMLCVHPAVPSQDVGTVLSFDTSQIAAPPFRRLTVQFSDFLYVVTTTRSNVFIVKKAPVVAEEAEA